MNIDPLLADQHTQKYPLGERLTEGKTKIIYRVRNNAARCIVVAKSDITAGNGAKHDIIPGKGVWATETTCNVFELLARKGVPVAFIEHDNVNSFVAPLCTMLPYEVVVRREAHGSYLAREKSAAKGDRFDPLRVEFFLKTKDRKWKSIDLPCDDPYMLYAGCSTELRHEDLYMQSVGSSAFELHVPNEPFDTPFLKLDVREVWLYPKEDHYYGAMTTMARWAFLLLEEAWLREGIALVDFKVEFGITSDGKLLLADVIDNDSWRIVKDGKYLDKQTYRDGGGLEKVAELYELVARMTGSFASA